MPDAVGSGDVTDHAERTGRGAEAVDPAAVTKPRCRAAVEYRLRGTERRLPQCRFSTTGSAPTMAE